MIETINKRKPEIIQKTLRLKSIANVAIMKYTIPLPKYVAKN